MLTSHFPWGCIHGKRINNTNSKCGCRGEGGHVSVSVTKMLHLANAPALVLFYKAGAHSFPTPLVTQRGNGDLGSNPGLLNVKFKNLWPHYTLQIMRHRGFWENVVNSWLCSFHPRTTKLTLSRFREGCHSFTTTINHTCQLFSSFLIKDKK